MIGVIKALPKQVKNQTDGNRLNRRPRKKRFRTVWPIILLFLSSCLSPQNQQPAPEKNKPDREKTASRLTGEALFEVALAELPSDWEPVEQDEKKWIIEKDFDGNRFSDLALLCHKKPVFEQKPAAALEDSEYGIWVFFQENGVLLSQPNFLALGQHGRVSEMALFFVSPKNNKLPALTVSFENDLGRLEIWQVYNGRDFSKFETLNSLIKVSFAKDIDFDGIIDLVVFEQSINKGFGFETEATWWRWSGRGFNLWQKTNLVQNLNDFLVQTQKRLATKKWQNLIIEPVGFNKQEIPNKGKAGIEQSDLNFFFVPVGQEDLPEKAFAETEPRKVNFPLLLENPFVFKDLEKTITTIIFEVIDADYASYFYRCQIQLNPNPFGQPQFAFIHTFNRDVSRRP